MRTSGSEADLERREPKFLVMDSNGVLQHLEPEATLVPPLGEHSSVSLSGPSKGLSIKRASFLQDAAKHAEAKLSGKQRVCLVDEQSTGLLMDRNFRIPSKGDGDRALLQLAVTGHGWANTELHCGEFCHAVYGLSFNGKPGPKVSVWRDDCRVNPWGPAQAGTWDESRNGWCPGSVEPGVFLDVTDMVKEGNNNMQIDMWVFDEGTQKYHRFTDISGYDKEDLAKMVVGSTMSIYPKQAVDTIRKQEQAFTAAEKALRQGSSAALLETPAFEAQLAAGSSLLEGGSMSTPLPGNNDSNSSHSHQHNERHRYVSELRARKSRAKSQGTRTAAGMVEVHGLADRSDTREHSSGSFLQTNNHTGSSLNENLVDFSSDCKSRVGLLHGEDKAVLSNFDFEKAAPWYCYSDKGEELKALKNVQRISLFQREGIDISTRTTTRALGEHLGLPTDFKWSHAALHFRLDSPNFQGKAEDGKPYVNEFDHWDRVGSLGLHLSKDLESSMLELHPAPAREKRDWTLYELGGK